MHHVAETVGALRAPPLRPNARLWTWSATPSRNSGTVRPKLGTTLSTFGPNLANT